MNLQGYIKEIGTPREWKTQEGETRYSYPITISIPFVGSDGKERSDDIITDHVAGNPEYIKKLKEEKSKGTRMDFRVGFSLREYQGKQYQNARLYDVQILL